MGLARDLIRRLGVLKGRQTFWHKLWEDCARYCLPNAAPLRVYIQHTEGEAKKQPLDVSGIDSASKLSAWLYSSTIYQGEDWFSLKARKINGVDEDDYQVDEWLQFAAKAVLNCINPSNFIQVYQQALRGYTVFGTGVIYIDFNDRNELVCKQFNITDGIYIAEDSNGEVDTVFREFEYTARQAVQAFGFENLSTDIQKAAEKEQDKDKRFKFIHCVYPRKKEYADSRKRLPKYKKYASIYIELEKEKIVENGGTDTFPYCVPRFYNTGEVYGRSPAMSALPALRSLNMETYTYIDNTRSVGRPIAFVPTNMLDDVEGELIPGRVIPYNSDDGKLVLWSASGDLGSSLDFIARVREDVRGVFYNDVFQYLEDRKNMTATEAQLRYDEMIQGISPVLANLQNDLFKRLISRIVIHLIGCGKIPVPESFIDGNGKQRLPDFDVVYTSRLDTKIKGVQNADMLNCMRMLSEIFSYAENPQMAARIDFDKVAERIIANNNVAGVGILLPRDEVERNLSAMNESAQTQNMRGLIKPMDAQKEPEAGSLQAQMQEML